MDLTGHQTLKHGGRRGTFTPKHKQRVNQTARHSWFFQSSFDKLKCQLAKQLADKT